MGIVLTNLETVEGERITAYTTYAGTSTSSPVY